MGRQWILIGMMFLLLPWVLAGCGISQELYDAALAERDSLVANLQSVQSELEATKSKLDSVQSELESMKSQFQSAKDELDTKKSELKTASNQLSIAQTTIEDHEQKMAKAKTYTEIVSALFVPVLKGEEGEINPIDFLFDWKESVEAAGDSELKNCSKLWWILNLNLRS